MQLKRLIVIAFLFSVALSCKEDDAAEKAYEKEVLAKR